jgi:hypothetical protein
VSTPAHQTPRPAPTRPNPNPQPMVHGGRPDGGKHVPSNVPGAGAYDASGAVGSNVMPAASVAPGASDDVLDAPPPAMGYPSAQTWNPAV